MGQMNGVGHLLKLTINKSDGAPWDVATASVKTIYITKPDSSVLTKTAGFFTDGTDGILTHVFEEGDLNKKGKYKVQAYCEVGTEKLYSSIAEFTERLNLV